MTYKNNNIIPEIFASIIAVVAGILIYVSRLGFDNYGTLIIKTIFVSFFLIYTPHFVKTKILEKPSKEWYFSKSFILFICIILLVLAGQISINLGIDLSSLFSLLGGVIFIATIIDSKKNDYSPINLLLFMLFIFFGVWATSAYCMKYYYHPLIGEKIISGAWAHRDNLWFSAMAGMFKTYSVSSNGLDGLVPVYYHTLSHFIYGLLSGLLDVSTLIFFNINVPILIIPVFFLAFIYCVKESNEYFSIKLNINRVDEKNIKYWILFSVLFFLPLPYQLLDRGGGEIYQYIGSSSYSLALLLTFILLSIIFSFINLYNTKGIIVSLPKKLFLVIISILFYLAISLSKVSFLFVVGLIYCYVFIRMKFYKNFWHIIVMSGLIMVVAIVYVLIVNTETFLKNPHQVTSSDVSLLKYIFYILPSSVFIALKLYSINIRSISNLFEKIKNKEILDIEILFLLIIILFPFSFQYFKGIQIYLAYILIMSHMNLFIDSIFHNKLLPTKQ